MKKWGIMGDCNEKMLNKGRSGRQFMILVLVALACVSSGCRKQEARERQDLDFTVCAETELPDDLRQIIEEKKLHAFQMSYTTKDHLYMGNTTVPICVWLWRNCIRLTGQSI